MALKRSDYDQAARYLKRVSELMERDAKALTRILRELLAMAVKRLSSGETAVGDAIAEIALLRTTAKRLVEIKSPVVHHALNFSRAHFQPPFWYGRLWASRFSSLLRMSNYPGQACICSLKTARDHDRKLRDSRHQEIHLRKLIPTRHCPCSDRSHSGF
jgi:hypothetical protein